LTATHGFVALLTRYYDKLIALVAFACLIGVLSILLLGKGREASEAQAYSNRIDSLKPENPEVEAISLVAYSNAMANLDRPYRIPIDSTRQAGFFIPETRIWCANRDCLALLPRAATECPVCQTVQPPEPTEVAGYDGDGGGIPDAWERKYGLNPHDPADDRLDSDGDGFDNLAEFKADTDPTDPKSHPDLLGLIRVERIVATRLPIKFMGATRLPNGQHRCQINMWEGGQQQATTYFVLEGEPIGKTEFKLLRYHETPEKRISPVTGTPMTFIDKMVEIGRGGKVIKLKLDENAVEADYKITLVQTLDGSRFEVAGDGEFKVGDKKYRVISVDNQATAVVLRSDADEVDVTIPKL
jgi:hypothetical protein